MFPSVNVFSVFMAAVIGMALGFLWYGPLFGKPWMKLMGFTKESMGKSKRNGMAKTYAIMALGSLISAFVLAHFTEFAMNYTRVYGVNGGLLTGAWAWLGFVAPVKVGDQLWGKKPWKLFLLDGGYHLVSLLLMGALLATWR